MAGSCEDTVLTDSVNKCLKEKFSVHKLYAVSFILKGVITLCISPTGFGKSLIYQFLPSLFLKIDTETVTSTSSITNPVIVVLSPL